MTYRDPGSGWAGWAFAHPIFRETESLNRYWRISTNPDTSKKKYPLLKLMQESSMVPLSWLMKKNWNLNLGKKSSFCIENGTFYLKLSVIKLKSSIFSTKWTFFPQVQIFIFLHKSTQWDHRRLLHKFQEVLFFLLVSGFVLMGQ